MVAESVQSPFRRVFDVSPSGQLLVDREARIVLANQAMQAILGYTPDDLAGQPLSMLLPDRHRGVHDGHMQGYWADPQVRMMGTGRDLTALHADGTEVPVEVGLSSVPWEGSVHALATVVDISGRSRLEMQLRRANANLEEFTYVASHDLRSPLRGIRDLVEWIGEDLAGTEPPSVTKNLDRIRVRIDRMQGLVDALLEYARSGLGPERLVRVDLAEILAGIADLQPMPDGFVLAIDVQVGPFLAAQTPLATVLRNLIGNAVKHHDRPTGQVRVSARPHGEFCRIDVTDDGPGIPAAAHERIFRLFQTLSEPEPGGSGIGLALVKRLVGTHGGRIEVMPNTDNQRGTTFRVWWPRFPRKGLHES